MTSKSSKTCSRSRSKGRGNTLMGFSTYVTRVGRKTLEMEDKRIDDDNRRLNVRLALAARGSGYPGPLQAAQAMQRIEQVRYHRTSGRLDQEEQETQRVEKATEKLINSVAGIFHRGGTVDCWFDYGKFNSEIQANFHTQRAKAEQRYQAKEATQLACYKQNVKSEYSKEATAPRWHFMRKKFAKYARHPQSAWHHEYMSQVAHTPPLRKAPPHHVLPPIERIDDQARRRLHSCLVNTIYL